MDLTRGFRCRLPVGSDGILSFTRTKKLFLLQWPDGIRNSGSTEGRPPGPIDGQLTEENPSKNSDDNRLPFGIPSELYRGFLGTVSLLPDGKESCSLRWTLSRKRVREELETFENVVFAPPIRECKPEKDIFRREDCVKDEDEGCSEERISEGVSCKCQGSEFSDVSESLGAEPACVGLAGLCAGDRSGLLGREQQENDDKMASPLISSCKRGGGEPEIQLTHSLVGRIPSPSAFRKLTTKTTGEVSRPSACSKCGKIIRKHSFSDTGLSIDVKAPWFGTLWRCLPLITHRSLSACLFDDGDVEVLLSVDYLVVVIYPLLAHVYSSRAETWTELVFCGPVLRCCLVGGKRGGSYVGFLLPLTLSLPSSKSTFPIRLSLRQIPLTLSFPTVAISNFPCSLTRNTKSHSMKNLAFHSSRCIVVIHFSLKCWENVLFELGSERVSIWSICSSDVMPVTPSIFINWSACSRHKKSNMRIAGSR